MEIFELTDQNIDNIKWLYEDFSKVAMSEYLFELPPLPFNDLKANIKEHFIKGYFSQEETATGFLLYSDAINQSVELSLIYTVERDDDYIIKSALLTKFLDDAKQKYKSKTISYPMLGVQKNFTQDITALGFKLVGEMVLEIDFKNKISDIILAKAQVPDLGKDYTFDYWKDKYSTAATEIICKEFSHQPDSKFDKRFSTPNGTKEILDAITTGYYGNFYPELVTVLLYKSEPVGFCFINFTTDEIANIPILAIAKNHQGKGYGKSIIKNSVTAVKKLFCERKNISKQLINVTCGTDNYGAIKSYRTIGFKEQYYYPHAYLEL